MHWVIVIFRTLTRNSGSGYEIIMTDDLKAKMAALREEFLERTAIRMEKIRGHLEALAGGADDAKADLTQVVHKLSGGGGTFGFHLVSRIAGDMESLLLDGDPDLARLGRLAAGLQTLVDAGGALDAAAEAKLLNDLAGDLIEIS